MRFLCFTRFGTMENDSGADVVFIESSVYHASSSEVRAGDMSMLSERVGEYVRDNKLYGA